MNAHSPNEVRRSKTARRRGVALVVVLGMLVLVLVLVVAFLSSVSVELQSAKKYSGGADARALADSAVSLVISQIQDATTNPRLAWASQPGMVRTFDSSGAPTVAYKLYSSGTMRVTGAYSPVANVGTEVPGNWSTMNALYTDLNRPVAVSGTNRYPILDPSAVGLNVSSSGTALVGSNPIEGCYVDTTNVALAVSGSQTNPLPMPVQWLYVLNSGSLVAMNPATGIVSGASTSDPIVGRIAFWTDDESSKVNINTASEGTFWDRPWTRGTYENSLNASMPMADEYQRFTGHPAMTSLSVIFPPLSGESIRDYNERLYRIIPRIGGGGSESGTVVNTQAAGSSVASPVPDAERLFSTVDEFFFTATNVASGSRVANPSGPSTTFSVADMEKTRFFLTANSRAPEVNLFNKPRVTLWPLQKDPAPSTGIATRTAKDKLIAFCSTIGSGADAKPYYFERYNTYNFEQNIRPDGVDNWASKQDPMPSSQSSLMDYYLSSNVAAPPTKDSRNQELFKYLQSLTKDSIPGLGGSLLDKYPNTRDQILVESLDFIRSTVNPQTTITGQPSGNMEYFYAPGYKRGQNPAYYNVIGQGQVVPMLVPGLGNVIHGKGFGRVTSIKQAVLVFYASNGNEFISKPTGTLGATTEDLQKMHENQLTMRIALLLDPFTVTPGPPSLCTNLRYRVTWEDACRVNGAPVNFPSPATSLLTARDQDLNRTPMGGIEYPFKYYEKPNSGQDSGGDHFDLPKTIGTPNVGDLHEERYYPFVSSPIVVPGVSGTVALPSFSFEGGSLLIEIFPGYSRNPTMDPNECIQSIRMSFPKAAVQLPRPELELASSGTPAMAGASALTDFNERMRRTGVEPGYSHNLKPLIRPRDTVRSIEVSPAGPSKGDLRIVAGQKNVTADYFGPLPDYATVTVPTHGNLAIKSLHNFRLYPYTLNGSASNVYSGYNVKAPAQPTAPITKAKITTATTGVFDAGLRGRLVPTLYRDDRNGGGAGYPIVPTGLLSAKMANGADGDWDTGLGGLADGAYINPADQGNNSRYFTYFGAGTNPQTWNPNESGSTYSPSRQISSAVSFGSLPTGIDPNNPSNVDPWRTLLFCKNPAAGSAHPGFGIPIAGPPFTTAPDHAFLDLFTMPVVEPYAISEPFSTAGKVNMNYQIAPFTYLTRNTGVRAVLKSTAMTAIPVGDALTYKLGTNVADYRYTIDPDETTGTLAGFQQRFNGGDIFRSASEICDIFLVPKNRVNAPTSAPGSPTYATMSNWWNSYTLTGDNVREQPYGHIYPRLTTKSNTFTVHVIAQSIAKANSTPANQFIEGKDQITGEFRGSFLLERYLDPNADFLVKADQRTPGSETDPDSMVGPYKFRVISTKRFAP